MENNLDSRWLEKRLAATTPPWMPNTERAWAKLQENRPDRKTNRLILAAAVTAAILAVIVVAPQGRALAQELWVRFLLTRIEVVRLDLSRLPVRSDISSNGMEQGFADAASAAARAGFRPRLPAASVLPGTPAFSVTGPLRVTQTIRVAEIREALEHAGVRDAQVPPEWEGASIRALIGPMVIAVYPGNIQILQLQPIELLSPPGLPLDRVAETVLRAAGMRWWEARAFGRKFAANPGWLLHVPADEPAAVSEVALRNGTGLIIEDGPEEDQPGRASVIYSGPDRIFLVSSPDRGTSIRIANALE